MRKYTLRTFREGDEIELIELFNRVHNNFAGFVPRTRRFWLWCCLDRPDVDRESVAIVNDGEEIVGYAVVGRSGDVWELCYDPRYDAETVASMLLEWAVEFVEEAGGDRVRVNGLLEDDVLRKVCEELGFCEAKPVPQFVSVLDLPNFLAQLLERRGKVLDLEDGVFAFRLRDHPSWCSDQIVICVKGGEVRVYDESVDDPEIVVDINWSTLLSCILGTKSVWRAVLNSEIRVHPFWKFRKFRKMFSCLHVGRPWFWPLADHG